MVQRPRNSGEKQRSAVAGEEVTASSLRKKHDCFLSYARDADESIAACVHRFLNGFARPWYRPRALRVFRDATSLPLTPDFWRILEEAIGASSAFVLLACPESAGSPNVEREVEFWLEKDNAASPLIVLTGGDLEWDRAAGAFDSTKTTALSSTLAGHFGSEPLYVDLRWARTETELHHRDDRLRALLTPLAAALHGTPAEELLDEDLRQHWRAVKVWVAMGALLVSLVAVALWTLLLSISSEKARAREERVSNYNQAMLLEQGATLSLEQARESAHWSRFADAWCFTLAALDIELGENRSLPRSMGRLVDPQLQREAFRLLWSSVPRPGRFDSASFAPDGSSVVLGVSAMERWPGVRIWDLDSGAALYTLGSDLGLIGSTLFLPGGREVAIASSKGLILWNVELRLWRAISPDDVWFGLVDVSPDGAELAGARVHSGELAFWNLESKERLAGMQCSSEPISVFAFHPSSPSLAIGDDGGVVHLRHRGTGEEIWRAPGHAGRVSGLTFVRGGKELVSCSWDGSLRLWRVDSGREVATISEGQEAYLDVTVLSGMPSRVAAVRDDAVELWNLGDGEAVLVWSVPIEGASVVDSAPGGARLVVAGEGASLLDSATGATLAAARGHSDRIAGLSLHPSGDFLASWSKGELLLWGLQDGGDLVPRQLARRLCAATFTGSGSLLALLSDGTVRSWKLEEASTREEQWTASEPQGLAAAQFDVAGQYLAFEGEDHRIAVYDIPGRRLLLTLEGHSEWIDALSFSDRGTVASVGRDGRVRLWDVSSGQLTFEYQEEAGWPTCVALDSAGAVLSWGTSQGGVRVWNVPEGRFKMERDLPEGYVMSLGLSPDGDTLAVGTSVGVSLWDVPTEHQLLLLDGPSPVTAALAFGKQGQLLASGSAAGVIQLWDAGGVRRPSLPSGPTAWLRPDSSSDPELVVLAFLDGSAALFDAESGEQRLSAWTEGAAGAQLSVSPDARYGVVLKGDGLRVVHLGSGVKWIDQSFFFERIPCAAFDPTGRYLAVGTGDILYSFENEVWLWDLESRERIAILSGHSKFVRCVAVSPDGSVVTSGSGDGTVRIWDGRAGSELRSIEAESTCMAVIPRRDLVAIGAKKTVSLFDLETGQRSGELTDSSSPVECMAASLDGALLAAGCAGGDVYLWDMQEAGLIARFHVDGDVRQLAFSPLGNMLSIWSDQGVSRRRIEPLMAALKGPSRKETITAIRQLSFDALSRNLEGADLEPRAPEYRVFHPSREPARPVTRYRSRPRDIWSWLASEER